MEKKGFGQDHKRYAVAAIAAAVFYFLCNGYRFFNPLLSGDALLMLYQNDAAWQIALGRVGQPFLVFLRGGIASPFLISVLAMFWIALSVVIVTDLLDLNSTGSILSAAAVMGCHISFIAANANFLPWVDFYGFALFLATGGIWLLRKERKAAKIAGIVALAICMSVYQAYICVAIGLMMICLLLDLLKKSDVKRYFINALLSAGALLCGALLYLGFWKVIQKSLHIWTADSYNGLAGVGDYSDGSVFTVLGFTYANVLDYFLDPLRFITMTFREKDLSIVWTIVLRIGNIAAFGILLYLLILRNKTAKNALWQKIMQAVLLLLFPFGINFVCFMSKGMEHSLMIYAFCLVYVLLLAVLEQRAPEDQKQRISSGIVITVCLIIALQTWSHIVYANQVWVKKQAQEEAARSLMMRIESVIEQAEGYIPGETPVAFAGSFEISPYIQAQDVFSNLQPWGTAQTALSYIGTDYAYLAYFENMKLNLTRIDAQDERVRKMPCYPLAGSVDYIDGVLVVKISD